MVVAQDGQQRGRRTQAQRRAATEAALLAAAADVVSESGVGALTLAGVGERAGYSRGIVNHHFGSKLAMLEALTRTAQSGLVAVVEDMDPGLGRLLRLIEEYLTSMAGNDRRWSVFLLIWAQAATTPELAQIMRERDDYFRRHVSADVAAGVASGAIQGDIDAESVAIALIGELRGIGLQKIVDPQAVDPERLAQSVTAHWRHALTGHG